MFWKMNSVSEPKCLMLILLKGVEQNKTLVFRCPTEHPRPTTQISDICCLFLIFSKSFFLIFDIHISFVINLTISPKFLSM